MIGFMSAMTCSCKPNTLRRARIARSIALDILPAPPGCATVRATPGPTPPGLAKTLVFWRYSRAIGAVVGLSIGTHDSSLLSRAVQRLFLLDGVRGVGGVRGARGVNNPWLGLCLGIAGVLSSVTSQCSSATTPDLKLDSLLSSFPIWSSDRNGCPARVLISCR